MRTARLVGPTADGSSIVLVTEDGEELNLPVDAALRSAWPAAAPSPTAPPPPSTPVRRPPRRRETPVDTTLSPRDIQSRIRSGASLEDVVAESGLDADRVERFAAPVLAEREHMALTALGAWVRRRGDGAGHRPLRAVVAERLLGQGVDADDVSWDAWRREDAQWQVTADFELGDEARHAEFRYDPQGRFSMAEDDDARWLAGERPSPASASIDRDDELALVRATQDADVDADRDTDRDPVDTSETRLQVVPPAELSEEELDELVAHDPESEESEDAADTEPTLVARRDEAAEPTVAIVRQLTSVTVELDETGETDDAESASSPEEVRSALDTLYDMLGGDGYTEESTRVYAGLTDASAVPVVDEHEFEPAADTLVPAEPDTEPAAPDDAAGADDEPTGAEEPPVDEPEPLVPSPGASRRPGRRKRASVPSWDEIMFGGPKPGSSA